MSKNFKDRDISILDYFEVLQLEYFLYELRSKIYPFKKDKERYKEVMGFKKEKIENISIKNNLKSIFNSSEKKLEVFNRFLNENGVPKNMSNRDKYHYYYIGSDFSYKGKGYKLRKYDFDKRTAVIENSNYDKIEVDLSEIKRIL